MSDTRKIELTLRKQVFSIRFLAASDSHGSFNRLYDMICIHPDIDTIFFMGDGERDADRISFEFAKKKICAVSGNCDIASMLPGISFYICGGTKILYTHGDGFNVKCTLSNLAAAAKQSGASLALFGHTHMPVTEYREGIILFNPGSIRDGRYGIIEISEQGIKTSHESL